MTVELLTVGRVGVDLYPQQSGVPLSEVDTFAKSLGGTATNVAVAAARLGRRTAVLTKVGPDGFGDYVRAALAGFGVSPEHVGTNRELLTPVVFCELNPPEDPPLLFYRLPTAPDMTLIPEDVPWEVVRDVPVLWVTGTGVSAEPARSTQRRILEQRDRRAHTVLDLDHRPMFWPDAAAAGAQYRWMLDHVTVVVGNRAEAEIAVGTADPDEAATRLLDHGVELVFIKKGGDGVLVASRQGRWTVPPHPVEVVCGLGAGDAFGGALVHGLLSGLGAGRDRPLRQRRGRAGGVPAGLRGRDADRGGDQGPAVITDRMWAELLHTRAHDPWAVGRAYAERRRRTRLLTTAGTLFLVAADHPARGALAVGDDPLAMADRRDLLDRLLVALADPGVDGVLGTPDVLEELLLLGALDDKVVIGSMNRGGLAGAGWEIDDRFTAYDPAAITGHRLDGGKMLLRIVDDDPGTVPTLQACAQAVSALAARGVLAMVEPLPYRRTAGKLVLCDDAASLARAVAVASGLGTTSAHTWLKLPAAEPAVLNATTLPVLVLGGVPSGDPAADLASWGAALAHPVVRGLVVGRTLLYPPDGDVAAAVRAAVEVLDKTKARSA